MQRKDLTNMEYVSTLNKLESIKSLQSTISKLENALSQMTQKGSNTTLVKKRLKAIYVGLAILDNFWNEKPHHYTLKDLSEARNVLSVLLPSIETSYDQSKARSPQRTL